MNKQTGTLLFAYQTIADMEVKIIAQADRIAELEVKLSRAETTGGKAQAKRDLEMKEKGVYEFTSSTGFWDLSTCKLRTYSRDFQKHLRKQASDL